MGNFIVACRRCRVSYNRATDLRVRLASCAPYSQIHSRGDSAKRMFDLVADVPAYPHFMPWCGGASAQTLDDGMVRAKIDIHFGTVQSAFTTLNRHVPYKRIDMEFVDGPFNALTGCWDFSPLTADACKVEFVLDYEFASGLMGRVIAPVFDVIAASFVDAFSTRAEALYA